MTSVYSVALSWKWRKLSSGDGGQQFNVMFLHSSGCSVSFLITKLNFIIIINLIIFIYAWQKERMKYAPHIIHQIRE